jgi:ketosteroid isomerase-like protein
LTADLISVALFGDCAIASGLTEANWKNERDNPQRSTFRFLALLQKQKGDWKLVATQSTKFNKLAEPVKK